MPGGWDTNSDLGWSLEDTPPIGAIPTGIEPAAFPLDGIQYASPPSLLLPTISVVSDIERADGAAPTMLEMPPISAPETKAGSKYNCPRPDCHYTTISGRDMRRHLQLRKHRRTSEGDCTAMKTFPCEIAGCTFPSDNSRRDNLIRYMENQHDINLERIKKRKNVS
jgi:hypothetical protein